MSEAASPDDQRYASFYRLDADDRVIAWGGPAWERFARDNQGDAIVALEGTSIYDHASGHFTKRFLREFFLAARAAAGRRSRRYRCDSPDLRRLMEMTARTQDDGALIVEHWLIEESKLPVSIAVRQRPSALRALHLRCSICSRLRERRHPAWLEPEQMFPHGGGAKVAHTVCPDCRKGVALSWPIASRPDRDSGEASAEPRHARSRLGPINSE